MCAAGVRHLIYRKQLARTENSRGARWSGIRGSTHKGSSEGCGQNWQAFPQLRTQQRSGTVGDGGQGRPISQRLSPPPPGSRGPVREPEWSYSQQCAWWHLRWDLPPKERTVSDTALAQQQAFPRPLVSRAVSERGAGEEPGAPPKCLGLRRTPTSRRAVSGRCCGGSRPHISV